MRRCRNRSSELIHGEVDDDDDDDLYYKLIRSLPVIPSGYLNEGAS